MVPAGAMPDAVVAMPGRWELVGDDIRFTPRLPFARGVIYLLVRSTTDHAGATTWTELARLERSAPDSLPSASVIAIHPSASEVPENLLRFAITFSAPMAEGSAAERVALQDAAGLDIPHALFPMPPELWDRTRRRLTVLLEPGRIKRGLVPNVESGAPLEGRTAVDLVVDAAIFDATGAPLLSGARRCYRVGPPVRTRVDPALWDVSWPAPETVDALVVVFDRPLDHALALRCIVVVGEDGQDVRGSSTLDDGDVRWSFLPATPWTGGRVELRIDAALEDLAGNSVRRVFDRDLCLEADAPVDLDEVVLTPSGPSLITP